MLKSYLTIALRNLRRHPGYTFINVTGLTIGIACCLLILLFVRDEITFDRFHEKADRIIRVTLQLPERELEVTPTIVAPLFKRTIPEVDEAVRVYDIGRFRKTTVRHGGEAWLESGFMYADSTLFDVFTFPFLAGTPERALNRPNTLVLTESTARKYFDDPYAALGQVLQVGAQDFEVTGVVEDVPSNSHLQFNLLGSFVSTRWSQQEIWMSANFYTYLLMPDAGALPALRAKVDALVAEARVEWGLSEDFNLGLQRLTDLYLVHMGRERYVWLFTALALLILLIACINYMNLATARSARRAREVGMRKVLGAHRGQIIRQFFGESALLAGLSLLLGLAVAALLLPAFNEVSGKDLSLGVLGEPQMMLWLGALLFLITLGAGLYPSLLLSGFRPVVVLKGVWRSSPKNSAFRKVLVVFQFSTTMFLLIATTVVYNQLRYLQTTDVGFNREQVVVLPLADAASFQALPAFKAAVLQHPNVLHASAMNAIPGAQHGGYSLFKEGDIREGEEQPRIAASPVDAGIVETLQLDLLAGRGFSRPADELAGPDSARYQYVVNESLVRLAGWTVETAIGQRMSVSGGWRMGEVVGVIRDYNFLTLREEMHPLALFVEPEWNVLLLKITPQDVPGTLGFIRKNWEAVTGGSPFTYTFLDDEYASFYRAEQRLGKIFGGASLLAVLIACLGLFGLASYTAEQRTKEIGIRKVMGASVSGLVGMLNREFTLLVLVAFIIASPVAWGVMGRWLEGFAFRTTLSWWIFAAAGLSALLIAWLTVSYQSYRAATTDPVKALRYE